MMAITEYEELVKKVAKKAKERTGEVFLKNRRLEFNSNTNMLLLYNNLGDYSSGYLFPFIKKIIENKAKEIVEEALELEQKEYEEDVRNLKIASLEFAMQETLSDIFKKE